MGIAPYKTFTFDGVSSSAYGVYLTGEGVFNAPERAVEMIEVPGRNGTFALDQGRFQNITVTYRIGMYDVNETNFATKVSNFRNWLCSKVGYVRLSDDYNPDEYRMAVYMSGLELEHDFLIAGEAEITFECKPQRWLTSGETAVAVASGGTLTNPTLFDASPVLQIWGYGGFTVNGHEMEIISAPIGEIIVSNARAHDQQTFQFSFSDKYATIGDTLKFNQAAGAYVDVYVVLKDGTGFSSASATATDGSITLVSFNNKTRLKIRALPVNTSYAYGTSETRLASGTVSIVSNEHGTLSVSISCTVTYDGDDTYSIVGSYTLPNEMTASEVYTYHGDLILDSTQSALGSPIYFDLDIGEAYKIEDGVPITVNNAVTIPSDLPTLPPGTNTFTYDNTITQFKVVPRWWKV